MGKLSNGSRDNGSRDDGARPLPRKRNPNKSDWVFRGSGLEALWKESGTSREAGMKTRAASEVKEISQLLTKIKSAALAVDLGLHANALEGLYKYVWEKMCDEGFDGIVRSQVDTSTAMQMVFLIEDNEMIALRSIVGEKKLGQTSLVLFDADLRKRHILSLSSYYHREALYASLLIARGLERGRLAAYRAIFSSAFMNEERRQLESIEHDVDYTTFPQLDTNDSWQCDDFFAVAALASPHSEEYIQNNNSALGRHYGVQDAMPKLKIRVRGSTTDIKLVTADGRLLDDKTRCFTYEPKKRLLKAKRLECVTRSREYKTAARRRALVLSTLIGSLCLIHLAPAAIIQYWGHAPPNFFSFASYAVHADEIDFPFGNTQVDEREQATILLLLVASLVVGCLAVSLTELELWAAKDDKYLDFTVVDDEVRILDDDFKNTAFKKRSQGRKRTRKVEGAASILMQLADEAQPPLPKRKGRSKKGREARSYSYFSGFSSAGDTDNEVADDNECEPIIFGKATNEELLLSCRFPLTFSGRWIVDNARSDDPNLQLKALGVPWALRQALLRSPNVKRIIYEDHIWTEEAETVLVSKIQHLRLDGCRQTETHPIDGTEVHLWSQLGKRPTSAPPPPPDIPDHAQLKCTGDSVISVILYCGSGNHATIVRTLEDCGLTYHVQNQLYLAETQETILTHTFFSRHRNDPCLRAVPPDESLCR